MLIKSIINENLIKNIEIILLNIYLDNNSAFFIYDNNNFCHE